MIIDILYAVTICFAIWHGYQRGLILGVFSLAAIVIGLAAALKLSTVVASYIGKSINVSQEWLPFVSFIVVFILVVLLIRLAAKAIEKSVQTVLLGWANKLGGIAFYAVIYTLVFSVVLFYAEQMKFIQPDVIKKSATYSFVQPWGPKVIDSIGSVIPFFKDMFEKLQSFFEGVAKDIPPAGQS
jgi:membrane protein required for colicin V production